MENKNWHWQEPGTAWKGVGIYHVTLTVPSREPLLGSLVIPNNDPAQAKIERTELGNALIDEIYTIEKIHKPVRILQFCLMPDHLHLILHLRQEHEASIRAIIRGFWQGAKRLGRAHTLAINPELNPGTNDKEDIHINPELNPGTNNKEDIHIKPESNSGTNDKEDIHIKPELNSGTNNKEDIHINPELNSGTNDKVDMHINPELNSGTNNKEEQTYPFPIFTERPFIRVLTHHGQLQTMYNYVRMNPQRLATKRIYPDLFRVQDGIEIAGRVYRGVGNVELLQRARYMPVHVRRTMVEEAEHGDNSRLRNYMNSCVLAARKGAIMVSPFISPNEKKVMEVLLKEKLPFIYISDNGFRDYYKPQDSLFDAVADKRCLVLSPWEYDQTKKHVSRADCIAMNTMAEEICSLSHAPESDSDAMDKEGQQMNERGRDAMRSERK